MSDNTKKAQCIHCLHFFSKDSNSTLKNHISHPHCEALKRVAEPGQSSMSRDGSIFVYNPVVIREQFAGLVIQRGLPFNHFDDEQTTRVFQKHLQPKYNHVNRTTLKPMDILRVKATSVASESAFSTSRRVLSIRRTRLTPASLEMCMCLKDHLNAQERKQDKSTLETPVDFEEMILDAEVQANEAIPLSYEEIALDTASSECSMSRPGSRGEEAEAEKKSVVHSSTQSDPTCRRYAYVACALGALLCSVSTLANAVGLGIKPPTRVGEKKKKKKTGEDKGGPCPMAQAKMSNPLDMLEASCNGLVRRMVRLPQTISRAVDQGLNLMRNRPQYPPPNVPFHPNQHPPLDHSNHNYFQPGLGFLASFEQQYGLVHPFFYACRFEEFLDTNFVSWGGVVDRDEGLHVTRMLRPTIFPFCAVVARGFDNSLTVVQQMEGPMRPEELVEILQTTLEEQGLACDNRRAKEEEKRRADIQLRQEQDAAYAESLQADQEKESNLIRKKHRHQDNATQNAKDAKIVIRFPNGERKEKTFSDLDKIEAIFRFIDSLGLPGVAGNYKLVSTFPRKVYGIDCTKMKLKDAGFYPEATLFIEFV
nr:hypothetical protein [Tanacetum cinerariifolium]